MAFQHGIRVQEQPSGVTAPITGTASLQVVVGTAPINLADDPYAVTNKPILVNNWSEAVSKLGYSEEKDEKEHYLYSLCASMYASFKLFNVAPVIFINVLDPKKHKKNNEENTYPVEKMEATVPITGILPNTVSVKKGDDETPLEADTDYLLSFNDDGHLVITLIAGGGGADAESLKVSSTSIDPTVVTEQDIIGVTSGSDESGFEAIRQVYPKFGMTPGQLIAPGWSHIPNVGVVLNAKCQEINGYFSCEGYVDIDSTASGCTVYTDAKQYKENAGTTGSHVMALWPCVVSGSIKFWYSAVMAALTAYLDANNDDVPNLSPSNKMLGITGTVLADAKYTENADGTGGTWDKEVLLDQQQANVVNSFGVTTAFNNNGWRTWGNRTAAYPANTDPKDMWFCVRRFFSWWGNSFMLSYANKVDDPSNRRLIEDVVDAENIRGNAYVAQDKCAAARIELVPSENPVTNLIDGKLQFHQHLAPYVPAEDILNLLEFDPDALVSALTGG